MRVRSWVQRFVRNCRSPADQREFGELTPAELSRTETNIIREAQNEAFSDEVAALSRSPPLPRKSTLLPCTPILINRILRSNTRLRHADDLPVQQQMAPLPQLRLQMTTKPFANCAVDFGGQYLTIQGRGRSRAKRYLCLFLCLQTHCCHLEMATSLETDAFLNAFVLMTARRGWPTKMLSDNGSNFVGAELGKLDHDQVQRMTSNQGVTWH